MGRFSLIQMTLSVWLLLAAMTASSRATDEADDPSGLGELFKGYTGCMAVYDSERDEWVEYNPARCATRMLPCSTFKIPHALAALDDGVLSGPETTIDYDAIRQQGMEPHDGDEHYGVQTLHKAIELSLVWYFQEIARRLGPQREAAYLKQFGYGNMDSSSNLTSFWLDGGDNLEVPYGSLAISAEEQVCFLERMYNDELGVSPAATAGLKECIRKEESPEGYVLSGKTGSGRLPRKPGEEVPKLGWFVGYVERPGKAPVYFALNMEAPDWETIWNDRLSICKACLSKLGYWPEEK